MDRGRVLPRARDGCLRFESAHRDLPRGQRPSGAVSREFRVMRESVRVMVAVVFTLSVGVGCGDPPEDPPPRDAAADADTRRDAGVDGGGDGGTGAGGYVRCTDTCVSPMLTCESRPTPTYCESPDPCRICTAECETDADCPPSDSGVACVSGFCYARCTEAPGACPSGTTCAVALVGGEPVSRCVPSDE